jgi:hypothetical protein
MSAVATTDRTTTPDRVMLATPHCTRGNGTDRDRAGAAFHFLRTDANNNAFMAQWGAAKSGNPHVTGPLASDGVQEYGKKMTGAFSREVDSILECTPAI